MKRNMDLVREIFLQIEATEPGNPIKLDVPEFEKEEIGLHVELMIEDGLVKGVTIPSGDGSGHRILNYGIEGMTSEGRKFLNVVRNDTIWKKAMEECLKATGSITLDLLKAYLAERYF